MRLDLTLQQIATLRAALAEQYEDDERGWLDALEGETDVTELVRRFLEAIEAEEGIKAALTEQMEVRKLRRDRCDARMQVQREAIGAIMRTAGIDKLPLPEATITLRETPAKLALNAIEGVPQEYQRATYKPDLDAIKNAFVITEPLPNWLRLEPAKPSLSIRRK